jgi:hypothetical protein
MDLSELLVWAATYGAAHAQHDTNEKASREARRAVLNLRAYYASGDSEHPDIGMLREFCDVAAEMERKMKAATPPTGQRGTP